MFCDSFYGIISADREQNRSVGKERLRTNLGSIKYRRKEHGKSNINR